MWLKWAKTLFPFFCVSFSVCPFYIFVTISVLCLSFSPFMDFCSFLSPSLFVILFSYFSLFPFSVSPFHFLFQTTKPIISESNSGVMFWYQLITRNALSHTHSHPHTLTHAHTHIQYLEFLMWDMRNIFLLKPRKKHWQKVTT